MPAADSGFDLVIAGAGMIGSCFAAATATSGASVALVDPGPVMKENNDSDASRVSAINLASENILCAVGAWSFINTKLLSPFRQIEVWDAGSAGQVTFSAADSGLTHLGHIVENYSVTSALMRRLSHLDTVSRFSNEHIENVDSSDTRVTLTLSSGQAITAKLLVGADGALSTVRQAANIEVEEQPYDHGAIVTTVTTEIPHRETARQRFLATGPLAFLPLRDGRSSIVWSCTPERFCELNALDDDAFATALADAFEGRLGTITSVKKRTAFSLIRRHAQRYIAPRIALVGDAAHVIHPLAGLGANLGFTDAAALAEVLDDAAHKGKDIGDHSVLRRYERWRRGENELALKFMDIFYHAFGSSNPGVQSLRGFGLNLADSTHFFRHFFVGRATGLRGDLPKLARKPLA